MEVVILRTGHSSVSPPPAMGDYMKWGGAKGGRGGHPWSAGYAKLRRRQLTWWQERLALQTLGDLEDILGTVEKAT